MTSLGEKTFYGVYHTFEIFFDGTEEQFRELGSSKRVIRDVQVPGKYDVQPYCSTEGTYYKKEQVTASFDEFCADCQVVCIDGTRLYYGYKRG